MPVFEKNLKFYDVPENTSLYPINMPGSLVIYFLFFQMLGGGGDFIYTLMVPSSYQPCSNNIERRRHDGVTRFHVSDVLVVQLFDTYKQTDN